MKPDTATKSTESYTPCVEDNWVDFSGPGILRGPGGAVVDSGYFGLGLALLRRRLAQRRWPSRGPGLTGGYEAALLVEQLGVALFGDAEGWMPPAFLAGPHFRKVPAIQ